MKYIYLGAFPPPYGGVTIKNQLLYKMLSKYINIDHFNLKDKNINFFLKFINLFKIVFSNNIGLVIGISKDSLNFLTYLLYILNRKLMNRSIVMIMGGTFSQIVSEKSFLQKCIQEYKHIYVETSGMKEKLNSLNIFNVSVYPNCREEPNVKLNFPQNKSTLKCLFFSLISEDKGVDNILDAAKILEKKGIDFSIDFYGHIDQMYEENFHKEIASSKNNNYYGVLKSTDRNEVYEKLNSYDVLLFPTKWKNEGVPGVLIEAKIAGLPAIVSDINFNSEIVEDGKTGIVLKDNTPYDLVEAIENIYWNKDRLLELRSNVKASSKDYLVENYIQDIVAMIKKGNNQN
ncbi:glycosyltransferase [Metabacillus schmidteae]|uniref:glycosyltransferase n=1 Tax=Metabacillus schmidteae TaxID=2730405 RepID=UPI00158EA365|nr:glycosyltransferase [Metabacillus schmidteae]